MPAPLSVDEALARILDGVAPTPVEAVAIEAAHRLVQMNMDEKKQKQLVEEYIAQLPKETRA